MFGFFKRQPSSASQAKDRLQILLAHERATTNSPDFLPAMQKEILEVIRRHVKVSKEMVDIRLDRGDEISSLEINVELPGAAQLRSRKHRPA